MIGTGFLVLPRENCVCAPGATLQRQIVTLQSSGTLPSGLCTEVAGTVCTLYYRLLYGMAQRILGHEPSMVASDIDSLTGPSVLNVVHRDHAIKSALGGQSTAKYTLCHRAWCECYAIDKQQ